MRGVGDHLALRFALHREDHPMPKRGRQIAWAGLLDNKWTAGFPAGFRLNQGGVRGTLPPRIMESDRRALKDDVPFREPLCRHPMQRQTKDGDGPFGKLFCTTNTRIPVDHGTQKEF